jgi:hypothetical protein
LKDDNDPSDVEYRNRPSTFNTAEMTQEVLGH